MAKGSSSDQNALDALKAAHPTRTEWIDNGTATHYVLTGGKLLFPETPIPNNVTIPFHASFTSSVADFRRECPDLFGREATYSDIFWLMYGRYLALASSGRAKTNISITEAITTPCFRFFMDLDLLFAEQQDKPAWTVFIKALAKNVAHAIARCYPSISTRTDRTLDFTVMCTSFRGPKRGIHLVWPNLIVTRDVAIVLAAMVEERLSATMYRETSKGDNSWKDAIDISVYNTGLRLVGCVKATKCMDCAKLLSKCKRKKQALHDSLREAETQLCHPDPPRGFVVDNSASAYGLTHLARSDGILYTTTIVRETIAKHVSGPYDFSARALTSIRAEGVSQPTEGFIKPAHLCAKAEMADPFRRTTVTVDPVSGEVLAQRREAIHNQLRGMFDKAKEVIVDRSIHERLTEALRRFSPEHRNITVDRIWGWPLIKKGDTPLIPTRENQLPSTRTRYSEVWVMVKGEGSRYCYNKPGLHETNRVRFHIDYKGNVIQSCWSIKVHDGHDAPCCKKTTKDNRNLSYCLVDAYGQLMIDLFGVKKRGVDEDSENSMIAAVAQLNY